MRFLIVNMYGFRNKGCEASAKAIVNEMTKIENKAKFKIFTMDHAYDALWMTRSKNVSFLADPFRKWFFFSRYWQYKLAGKLGIVSSIKRGMEAYQWADAVLSTDDIFSSTYGGLFLCLARIQVAISSKKPVILIGQSVGPFENKREYKAFTKTMRHVQLINARESLTLKYLKKMNIKNTKIELTADPAFCLEPDSKIIEHLWKTYNIQNNKTLIGITPSQAITYFGKTSYNDHFKTLEKLVKYLIKECECHIVLIPHVQDVIIKNNDRVICEMLCRKLRFPENLTVISLEHSAEEIRAIIARLDLLIAERMHAAIASLSHNVPTFVIGYSVKAQGILGDIFGFSSLEDYMIPVTGLNEEVLKERVKNLLDKRSEVTQHLSKVMPHIKENAKRNFTLAFDVLR